MFKMLTRGRWIASKNAITFAKFYIQQQRLKTSKDPAIAA